MTFEQITTEIERKGWKLLAQSCHPGGLVSYDAMKGQGKWPLGRKLAKGEPRRAPYAALRSTLRECEFRDLGTARRRVIA